MNVRKMCRLEMCHSGSALGKLSPFSNPCTLTDHHGSLRLRHTHNLIPSLKASRALGNRLSSFYERSVVASKVSQSAVDFSSV